MPRTLQPTTQRALPGRAPPPPRVSRKSRSSRLIWLMPVSCLRHNGKVLAARQSTRVARPRTESTPLRAWPVPQPPPPRQSSTLHESGRYPLETCLQLFDRRGGIDAFDLVDGHRVPRRDRTALRRDSASRGTCGKPVDGGSPAAAGRRLIIGEHHPPCQRPARQSGFGASVACSGSRERTSLMRPANWPRLGQTVSPPPVFLCPGSRGVVNYRPHCHRRDRRGPQSWR